MEVITHPKVLDAFERYVAAEDELATLLDERRAAVRQSSRACAGVGGQRADRGSGRRRGVERVRGADLVERRALGGRAPRARAPRR